ncbi:hypothetical protein BCR44DRAFT_1083094 [Catenaria anguillulae PL171]|uniref:Uncharacterized protein n=1 Tax=Catenaria anguillulae PL171 TaxID=765915 RepID=A0A1Y2HNH6_9FUNG|nr:hypothetical protein BCR44DRAFT_1083094 [Catenaria anguillulae PL171]
MYSGNRRFSSITWRVFSQEHFLSDGTFPITDIVKNSRIALRNLQHYHDLLTNDANGPSAMFPNHTIFPRDCTHKSACPGAPEMDDVGMGWTRAIASQPLNAEIDRLIQIGYQVAESMVDDMLNESTALSRATAHAQWRLSLALSRDIVLRSTELNELMRSRMRAQLAHASIVCNVMLAVTVMVLVACALAYQAACAGPLMSEARTVVTLLYMIPPNLVKEAKDVARFCETAGVELEIKPGK